MEVPKIISTKRQTFCGVAYYLCGHYFQRKGVRLHIEVWKRHNSATEVPDGYCVHHKDEDKSNNHPLNLELMLLGEHISHHMRNVGSHRLPEEALAAAALWHKSEEGLKWHRIHYENHKENLHNRIERICSHCGKTHSTHRKNGNSFCHLNCRAAFRRKSGVDNVDKICEVCGRTYSFYIRNKTPKHWCCSHKCRTHFRSPDSYRKTAI